MIYRPRIRLYVLMIFILIAGIGIWMCDAVAAGGDFSAPRRIVRVGFFAMPGYHMIKNDGAHSGYGYETLMLMARYTNWEYRFIGYDKSWQEMLQLLAAGDIDLLTSAQKTPEREQKFAYSSWPIGSSATIVTVRAGDERMVAGDYRTYEGARVGLLRGNSRNADFAKFAVQHGFGYVPVYFTSTEEMTAALQAGGTIDAIVTSNLRRIAHEWILNQFAPAPFYVIVRKDDAALLTEVNDAIQQLDIYSPGWQSTLFSKYYAADSGNVIGYTAAEREYLRSLQEQGIVLQVAMDPDSRPYSYFDNKGRACGILPDLFAEIAARAGIAYEILPVRDRAEYEQLRDNGAADIYLNSCTDYSAADKANIEISDSYLDVMVGQLTHRAFSGDIHTIAVPQGFHLLHGQDEQLLRDKEIKIFPSTKECVMAVESGACDAAYLYNYTAQQAIREDVRNQLRFTLMPDSRFGRTLGIARHCDYRLLSILNKSIRSVRGSSLPAQMAIKHMTAILDDEFSLERYMYTHPYVAAAIVGFILMVLAVIVFSVQHIRMAARERIRRQELERFVGYVCSANDLVIETDMDNHVCRQYMVQGKAIVKADIPYDIDKYRSCIHPEQAVAGNLLTEEALLQLIRAGREEYFECRLKRSDGQYHWYAHTIQAVPQTIQHPNSFILFRKDINASKQEEEREHEALTAAVETAHQANKVKGRFMSQMSHEIRTPLNAIIGYLALARMPGAAWKKVQHCLDNSEIAAKHLLQIINEVLDISAIESGRFKIINKSFDFREYIDSLLNVFYGQACSKGVDLSVIIQAVEEERIIGDKLRLNQILMNILSNALKFTPAGGSVTVTIEQVKTDEDHVLVRFETVDTGIGIEAEALARIFLPFEQATEQTGVQYGGTGLGLSITKNLVEIMKGSIEVSSIPQQGSVFTVSLPFQIDGTGRNFTAETAKQAFCGLRALLVDDKQEECIYLQSLLQRYGVEADTVFSGDEAVDIVKRPGSHYDFYILDWKLPDMDGLATVKRLLDVVTPAAPMMIVTAYDVGEIEDAARKAGAAGVIGKPLFPSTVFDLLVTYFGRRIDCKTAMPAIPATALAAIRILLVEDNAMNREITVEILSQRGIKVDTAVDGQDAFNKFIAAQPGTYQCILMDLQMPVMDGYDATRAIRNSSHADCNIPIIALTADVFPEDVAKTVACGMNGYISKPVDYKKLWEQLVKLLHNGDKQRR